MDEITKIGFDMDVWMTTIIKHLQIVPHWLIELREQVTPIYATHDIAHGLDHADNVAMAALHLTEFEPCTEREKELLLAGAYLHDVGLSSGDRKNHHIISANWVRVGRFPGIQTEFTPDECLKIACMCREHRASGNGWFSCKLCMLVAMADRGRPCLKTIVNRGYKAYITPAKRETLFGSGPYPDDPQIIRERALEVVCEHIHEKYGENGYATYSDLYRRVYAQELAHLRHDIAMLTVDNIAQYIQ
jgi:hypothetical protein